MSQEIMLVQFGSGLQLCRHQ